MHRVHAIWNSLPNEIVALTSANSFKNHLDIHRSYMEVKFDWSAADITRAEDNVFF